MSLHKHFKPANALPTPKESGLSMHATTEANKAVESTGRKRKYTSTFIPEERAAIGKYAAENGMPRQVESKVLEKAQFDC